MVAYVRHLHDLAEDAEVLDLGRLKVRWNADKVAELHLTFVTSGYALTVLATSLVHLPLHCVPIGEDSFKITDLTIPRVRVYHPRQQWGGIEGRQLHVISEELRGKTIRDLEEQLRAMSGLESAIKGGRG
ncbi:hypothetical protein CYMTET_39498 [Cymbomonas tetramitiformis]|uniref:Uncharacterized protein n=1 Tax=Cymbomonas tetramitiformis TaxID=36881 RepID=A0AAE0F5J2_9CHLO|nr:hypothetical protein CYMTET_39498 [Cymbomonas tetramitiformis]